MKKALALLLALAMMLTFGVSVAGVPTGENKDVNVGVSSDNGTPDDPSDDEVIKDEDIAVYSVSILWESMTFDIMVSDKEEDVTWNAADRCYYITDGEWAKTEAEIVVHNSSNVPLGVTAAFEDGSTTATQNGVTATVRGTRTVVDSAVGTFNSEPPTVAFYVNITTEAPESLPTLSFKVGTVVVSFTANVNP